MLEVELEYRSSAEANGQTRYCYLSKDGSQAPTLRLKPGDLLILRLKNELPTTEKPGRSYAGKSMASMNIGAGKASKPGTMSMAVTDPCASARMTATSTNLHFHGLTVPAGLPPG